MAPDSSAFALVMLNGAIVATAIRSIADEFGSIGRIAGYGSAYAVTNTVFSFLLDAGVCQLADV